MEEDNLLFAQLGVSAEAMAESPPEDVEMEEEEKPERPRLQTPRRKIKYTIEEGWRDTFLGEKNDPWAPFVERHPDGSGRVLIDFNTWMRDDIWMPRVGKFDIFPMPYHLPQTKSIIQKEETQHELDLMGWELFFLPMFIYTPVIYLMLRGVYLEDRNKDPYWKRPIKNARSVLRLYHVSILLLKTFDTVTRRQYGEVIDNLNKQTSLQEDMLLRMIGDDERMHALLQGAEDDEAFYDLVNLLASHTINQIMLLEKAIINLTGNETFDETRPEMRGLFLCSEGHLPDPEDPRLLPHFKAHHERWRRSNVDYINGRWRMLKRDAPLANEWDGVDNCMRSVNREVVMLMLHDILWHYQRKQEESE